MHSIGPMEFQVKRTRSGNSAPVKPKAKDDYIAAWLTEEGETDEVNLDDSTIIRKSSDPPPEPVPGQIDLHHADDARNVNIYA